MISKILVATDGSSNAMRGAEKALEFAKANKAEVMLVYVAYIPIMYRSDISDNLKESFIEDGKRILHDTEQVFRKAEYPVKTTLVRDEKPSLAICDLGREYDLIVMGTRGLHDEKERAIGSTSDKVIHCSPCSVLLVR